MGLLRQSLSVVEGQPARRDRDLDERRARVARRLGRLDPAGTAPLAPPVTATTEHPVTPDSSYDPFAPTVMADPLPFYRVLRDQYPVYYIDKWDTYALSRFCDIWQVLEIKDGAFVTS